MIIHGEEYNLDSFEHPGGKDLIARFAKHGADLASVIHQYHRFPERVVQRLQQYKVTSTRSRLSYSHISPEEYDYSLYLEAKKLASTCLPPLSFWLFALMQVTLYGLSIYCIYIKWFPILMSVFAAFCYIGCTFTLLHDASHYALFKNPRTNFRLSSFMCGLVLWSSRDWESHHVLLHHSFTNDEKLDPDNKSFSSFVNVKSVLGSMLPIWPYLLMFNQGTFQALSYRFTKSLTLLPIMPWKRMWTEVGKVEAVLHFLGVFIQIVVLILMGRYFPIYWICSNFLYCINILPDHHQECVPDKLPNSKCWFTLQVASSANFAMDNMLWTRWFGGINLQVVHHIYPKVCSWHYPELYAKLKSFCAKRNIEVHETSGLVACVVSCFRKMIKKTHM